ncbi:MAG: hypothetical protein ACO1QB_12420 [Verrucomicrobiales bacterium]
MKTILFACLLGAFWSQTLRAQEITLENSGPGMSAMEESRQRKQALEQRRRATAALMKQPIVYSGFLVDYTRAESKSKLLSLRQPATPLKDAQNVFTDVTTNRPKGFVLFALSF